MTALELRWDVTCARKEAGYWVAWCCLEPSTDRRTRDFNHCQPYAAGGDTEKSAKANLSALLVLAVAPRGMA